ncbi:carboxypeptidase regulatory-like domain-containing protein [Streptomyces sp. NBC_01224]|uniref:carboxypeptidase regulatory-like domain-containing protein n=1 Tax=Streptomyces sp. NBC_01224 TaxID=2903783 RepID=UPI003FA3D957
MAVQLPAQAVAASTVEAASPSATHAPSPTAPGAHPSHRVCAVPKRASQMSCRSFERDDVKVPKAQLAAAATPFGFGPADLQSAYNLPASSAGGGQAVAIVDAFDNPNAEAELAVYRQQYGLPPCTTANGCFKKVDQRGGTNYPPADSGWGAEIALDVQMVSATCPNCHILLVEADDNYMENLGAAVNEAVASGAKYVSNSWGGGEGSDESTFDGQYFKHPGVAITASSGDDGYGVSYPAASPYVTAVGGTSLVKDSSTRGWSEAAWGGAGSGCSRYEAKPSMQSDSGCARRTVADVSAVADPGTGVAVYVAGAWHVYGGTSVSAPITASVYALGGTPAAGSLPNTYPYVKPSALNDVTAGSNGSCSGSYLCTATTGYDGPTGLGTPKGVDAFASGPRAVVSGKVTGSAGRAPVAGATISAGDQSATTNAAGQYQLSVPPGTYDIKVAKFGYKPQIFSAVTLVDGQSLTENAALTARATAAVSGKVHDASGHGWPLYASVQVKGEPTSMVHTDPATGRYTLNLPVDDAYTLQVDAAYPGYEQADQDITVADTKLSQDFGVHVDEVSCTAAGYAHGALSSRGAGPSLPRVALPCSPAHQSGYGRVAVDASAGVALSLLVRQRASHITMTAEDLKDDRGEQRGSSVRSRTPARAAAVARRCRCAGRTGCPEGRAGPAPAGVPEPCPSRPVTTARSTPTGHRPRSTAAYSHHANDRIHPTGHAPRGHPCKISSRMKRVEKFSFRGCIRRPMGDPPGPTVPPYAARRRFARRLSVHSGR